MLKKFHFRKSIISRSSLDNNSPKKILPADSLTNAVKGIVALEKLKRKALQAKAKLAYDKNTRVEEAIKAKILRITKELDELKIFVKENNEKYESLKKEFFEINKKHEEDLNGLSLREAEELLFDKNKKKGLKPGEETQYLIKKERIRIMKQELHK